MFRIVNSGNLYSPLAAEMQLTIAAPPLPGHTYREVMYAKPFGSRATETAWLPAPTRTASAPAAVLRAPPPREQEGRPPMDDPRTSSPPPLPTDRPSVARMYDYMLGGFQNAAVDREAVRRAQAVYPDIAFVARANRAFLRRAVTFLLDRGIDQFLDLGSGSPTAGNTHQIAQRRNPAARVLYVDSDPIVVAQSTALLTDTPHATALRADARDPATILDHPTTRHLLDRDRPIGVLLLTVLHFLTDDAEAAAAVRTHREALAPGSYLALSRANYEEVAPAILAQCERLYAETSNPARARSRGETARFFAGLALAEPGLVYAPRWHPDDPDDPFLDQPGRSLSLVGVARRL